MSQKDWCGTRRPAPFLVAGKIVFPADAKFTGGMAFVRLEDTSLADAPAKLINEAIISNIDPSEDNEFEIHGDLPPVGPSYTLSVLVKVRPDPTSDSWSSAQVGDYITVQSYPVALSPDGPALVDVEVKLIG
jgi:hypothetical protein